MKPAGEHSNLPGTKQNGRSFDRPDATGLGSGWVLPNLIPARLMTHPCHIGSPILFLGSQVTATRLQKDASC